MRLEILETLHNWFQIGTFVFAVLVALCGFFAYGLNKKITNIKNADVSKEVKRVQIATDIPLLTLMRERIRTVKDESGYTTSLVFRPSNRQAIGSTVFIARIIGVSEAKIKDFYKIGISDEVKKSILRNDKEAIYHCRLEGYEFPELKLVTTAPATIAIMGGHVSEQPVTIEVK